MTITDAEIENWFKDFEDQTMDRKSIGIISHTEDLAELMVAFANNKFTSHEFGGRIIIGIDKNGNMDNLTAIQGHEELIMNVARTKCIPSLSPQFEKISYKGGVLYIITIPKMTDVPYQLKTEKGNVHKIRVGSTIREPTYEELRKLYSLNLDNNLNVDLPTDGLFLKLLLKLGRWYVNRYYETQDVLLKKETKILKLIGISLFLPIFVFVLWRMITHTFNIDYDVPVIMGLTFVMIGAVPCFLTMKLIGSRKCKNCDLNFAYEKIRSKLLDEKQFHTSDDTKKTIRIINNTFACYSCDHHTDDKIVEYTP